MVVDCWIEFVFLLNNLYTPMTESQVPCPDPVRVEILRSRRTLFPLTLTDPVGLDKKS